MRLSVFAGGCSLGAAEKVCAASGTGPKLHVLNGLASLVDKNLVKEQEIDGEQRFLMLDTIREYAAQKLEAEGEGLPVTQAFASVLLKLAEMAEPKLYGPDQQHWLGFLEREHDNFREAMVWLLACRRATEALRLTVALGWYWLRRGRFMQEQFWLEESLAIAAESETINLRAKALYYLGRPRYVVRDALPDRHHSIENSSTAIRERVPMRPTPCPSWGRPDSVRRCRGPRKQ